MQLDRRALLAAFGSAALAGCGGAPPAEGSGGTSPAETTSGSGTEAASPMPQTGPPTVRTASPTPEREINRRLSFGDWYETRDWAIRPREIDQRRELLLDDGCIAAPVTIPTTTPGETLYTLTPRSKLEMPDGKWLVTVTFDLKNISPKALIPPLAEKFAVAIDNQIMRPDGAIDHPYPRGKLDFDCLAEPASPRLQPMSPQEEIKSGATVTRWIGVVLDNRRETKTMQLAFDASGDSPYEIRWAT